MQQHKPHQLSQLNKQSHHAKHAAPQHLAASKHSKGGKKGGLESLTTFATPAGLVSDGIPNGLYGGFGAHPGYGYGAYGDFGLGFEGFGYGAYPYATAYGAYPYAAAYAAPVAAAAGYGVSNVANTVGIAGVAAAAVPAVAGGYAAAGRYVANSAGVVHVAKREAEADYDFM